MRIRFTVFYRLILCIYFNANKVCLHKYDTPVELFNSIQASSVLEHHYKALNIVHKASWKGKYEDDFLPSNSALCFHWLRSCWVSSVWNNVKLPIFDYPDVSLHGYKVSHENEETQVDIIWDT